MPTREQKRTWKQIVNENLNPIEMKAVNSDLGEKGKVAETESKEYHSIAAKKKKESEVCSTTLMAEIAQQPRRA